MNINLDFWIAQSMCLRTDLKNQHPWSQYFSDVLGLCVLSETVKEDTSFASNHDVHCKIQEGSQISLARDWSTSKLLPSVVLLMFWDEARKPGLGWLTKSAAKEKFNIQLWGIKSWRQHIKMKNILIKTTALVDQLATTSQISCFYEESHILMRFLHTL